MDVLLFGYEQLGKIVFSRIQTQLSPFLSQFSILISHIYSKANVQPLLFSSLILEIFKFGYNPFYLNSHIPYLISIQRQSL